MGGCVLHILPTRGRVTGDFDFTPLFCRIGSGLSYTTGLDFVMPSPCSSEDSRYVLCALFGKFLIMGFLTGGTGMADDSDVKFGVMDAAEVGAEEL